MTREEQQAQGANLRDVWYIATQPYGGPHFAAYPEKLVEPCMSSRGRRSAARARPVRRAVAKGGG